MTKKQQQAVENSLTRHNNLLGKGMVAAIVATTLDETHCNRYSVSGEHMETQTYEERRAAEQAIEAKREQEFQALIAGIVKLMPGWTLKAKGPDDGGLRDIITRDGMSIHFGRDWRAKDRLTVGTWGWPDYFTWNDRGEQSKQTITPRDLYDPKEESPSISVAINRGPDAIVKEITRRFLPDYERIYSRCFNKAIAYGTEQLKSREMWLEACRIAGVSPKYNSAHVQTKHGTLDIEKRHSEITMKIDGGLDTLKRILDALNSTDEA